MAAFQGDLKGTTLTPDELAELFGLLVGVVVFISLIGLDTFKALKKGAYWIPGDTVVLSALTIQLMNLLNGQSTLLKQILDSPQPLNGQVVKNNLFMIHSSRVMLCVLVAYLLPGMARPDSQESWGKLIALGLSIFLHISSDLFSVRRRFAESGLYLASNQSYFWPHAKAVSESSFIVSGVIISISLIWLIILLSCATIANKSIRDVIAQKIPINLGEKKKATYNSWQAVENQVLKSWIVARACHPEYIIARSVLATSAALAVTICILSSIVGWLVQGPIIKEFDSPTSWLKFITTNLEVVFILIGWAIIGWRWVTSVAYYGKWGREKHETWRNYFRVEDFWTRYILELREAAGQKSWPEKQKFDEKISKMIVTEGIGICLPGILLPCVFWLQFLVVYFSKACWFLSELILSNGLMLRLSSKLLSKHEQNVDLDLSEYKAILEKVHVLWDTPRCVFVTNRRSIKQAKELMTEGNRDGKICHTLIRYLRQHRKSTGCLGISCLDPGTSPHQANCKFLCKRNTGPLLDVEKHFIYASKRSWKLTAVSLINIILRLCPQCGIDSVKAYSEACELMDFVDEYDPETDSLLSKAADSLFKTLREQSAENAPATTTMEEEAAAIDDRAEESKMEEAARTIDELAKESKTKAEVIGDGQDSLDWKRAAAGNTLYKLCKSIDCRSGNFMELINELQSAFADVIGTCIDNVGAALVDNCMKWAEGLEERKLLRAVYPAGKCRGLMEELGWYPNVLITATTRESTMV